MHSRFSNASIWVCVFLCNSASAQWEPVGDGTFYGDVRSVTFDSLFERLYVTGAMRFMNPDTLEVNGITYWEDGQWHQMGGGANHTFSSWVCPPITTLCFYDSAVVVGGFFSLMDSLPNTKRIAQWRNDQWQPLGVDSTVDGVIHAFAVIDGALHALGILDTLDGVYVDNWAIWDGSTWSPGDTVIIANNTIAAVKFQGDLHLCGDYYIPGLGSQVLRKTTGGWEALGDGPTGAMNMNDMVVYDDLLWTASTYSDAEGPANGIMVWDGYQWMDPFPMIEFQLTCHDLLVRNNKLYMTGRMSVDGLAEAYGIAVYDGISLCIIGGPEVWTRRIESSSDTLYAAMNITASGYPDGDTVNCIGKWPLDLPADTCYAVHVGVSGTLGGSRGVSVYPNPSNGSFTLAWSDATPKDLELACFDALGRNIDLIWFLDGPGRVHCSLSDPPTGLFRICWTSSASSGSLGVLLVE